MSPNGYFFTKNHEKCGPFLAGEICQLVTGGILECDAQVFDRVGNHIAAGEFVKRVQRRQVSTPLPQENKVEPTSCHSLMLTVNKNPERTDMMSKKYIGIVSLVFASVAGLLRLSISAGWVDPSLFWLLCIMVSSGVACVSSTLWYVYRKSEKYDAEYDAEVRAEELETQKFIEDYKNLRSSVESSPSISVFD